MNSNGESETVQETIPHQELDESTGKPLTAEEIKLREIKKLKKKRYQENKKRKWYQSRVNTYIYI